MGLRAAIVSARARFGFKISLESGDLVIGDVGFRANHASMHALSYVFPSGSITGSTIKFSQMGHFKPSGIGSRLGIRISKTRAVLTRPLSAGYDTSPFSVSVSVSLYLSVALSLSLLRYQEMLLISISLWEKRTRKRKGKTKIETKNKTSSIPLF